MVQHMFYNTSCYGIYPPKIYHIVDKYIKLMVFHAIPYVAFTPHGILKDMQRSAEYPIWFVILCKCVYMWSI